MIGIVFNHDFSDDPYKQTSVEKGLDRLEAISKKLNEHLFTSISSTERHSLVGLDLTDEYVIVHHTCDLTDENKAEIADCIKEILTLKKTVYKNELPELVVVFSRISPADCICFNVE